MEQNKAVDFGQYCICPLFQQDNCFKMLPHAIFVNRLPDCYKQFICLVSLLKCLLGLVLILVRDLIQS